MRSALEAGIRQRVTRAGLLYTVSVIFVALAAFVSANNLLFLLFAMMLAALLVSGFVSRLTLAGLELDFALPEHISARNTVPARITVFNEKSWMTSFSIHLTGVPPSAFRTRLYFPAVPRSSRVRATVDVEFGRRGAYRENGFEFSTRFPFGFTERRIQVALRRDVLVYPALEAQPGFEALLSAISGDLESHQRGRGSDFYRIRPYEPNESARHVDWKATAHTGALQVREFAEERDPIVEVFLDLATPAAQSGWFERSVDCCAFLAWNTAQRDARIRFRTQEYDITAPAEGDVYTILKYLALVERKRNDDAPEPGEERSCQVVFTARHDAFVESGWAAAMFVGPETFPSSEASGDRQG
jgi:uncharacterized protein (DUF58 family)